MAPFVFELFYSLPDSGSTMSMADTHGFHDVLYIWISFEQQGDVSSNSGTGASQRMADGDSGTPDIRSVSWQV